jgi:hypothetical protein
MLVSYGLLSLYKPIAELMYPRGLLNFSMYQSGIDVKCPYSNRPLNPLNRLNAIYLFSG